jgi:hypothetical protein
MSEQLDYRIVQFLGPGEGDVVGSSVISIERSQRETDSGH